MKKIIFIKLGGSVITEKTSIDTLRSEVVSSLVEEIIEIQKKLVDTQLIIGHGHGSFGHVPLKKYKTIEGFIDQNSRLGMAKVLDKVAYLNQFIVNQFVIRNVAAISARINNSLVTKNTHPNKWFMDSIDQILKNDQLPIVCGDVFFDKKQGCSVWSTEYIFNFLVNYYLNEGFQIERIIHVGETIGFLDGENNLISKIDKKNWKNLKKHLTQTKGIDMTGGMKLKVEESLKLADKGVKTSIISGLERNNLFDLVINNKKIGTTIS